MTKIKQLSVHEAHKIAAGEVIERPVNIVKELVENALDAQATEITIEIKEGGKKLIRIIDNGCGMDTIDARLCFNKYATSKITCIEELQTIATFGFRGEALASIAAVSKITLITKEANRLEGIQLMLCDGTITHESARACNTGTDISIADLFYNIPARKKFLKTNDTEYRQILHFFQALCLAHPAHHFRLIVDGKELFNCPATSSPEARYAQLWDYTIAQDMITISVTEGTACSISGMISQPHRTRYDRSGIFLLVNNRWVKNNKLMNAVMQGYVGVLPAGQFPLALIALTVNPKELDINIHPRKEEVQFLHPRMVEQYVQKIIQQTLEQHASAQVKKSAVTVAEGAFKQSPSAPFQPQTAFVRDSYNTVQPLVSPANNFSYQPHTRLESHNFVVPKKSELDFEEPVINQHIPSEQTLYRIIGQLHKTYILLEQDDGLLLIDQHAAHERILYELFSTRFEQVAMVHLLFPQMIHISPSDTALITEHIPLFHANGIMLEVLGSDQLIVQSIAVHLKNVPLEELIRQIIGWIIEYQHVDEAMFKKQVHEKMHAQMACKAAVKAGDELTRETMEQLLHDLHKTNARFTCPHGRPTSYLFHTQDIEKKFKRDYKR